MTNKKPITALEILQKVRMHVSVPQCDVFGYLSIESEIVILIIPVDHYPKALQVRLATLAAILVMQRRLRGGKEVGAPWKLERTGERARLPLSDWTPGTLSLTIVQMRPPRPGE